VKAFGPHLVKELMGMCGENDNSLPDYLKGLDMEVLIGILKNGFHRVSQLIGFLGNGKCEENGNVKGNEDFLERVMLEEEYETMRGRIREKRKENRVLKEKIMIINLRAKELTKEKKRLQKEVDQKVYEKYQVLKKLRKDYEQTKRENMQYIDQLNEIRQQKEIIQDGYQMFLKENEHQRKEMRKLYNEKMNWFKERDQMLNKLEELDLGKFQRSNKILGMVNGEGRDNSSQLEELTQNMRKVMMRMEKLGDKENAHVNFKKEDNGIMSDHKQSRKQYVKFEERKSEKLLKNFTSNSIIKGLIIKNKVLKKENQKYFEFILELKTFLKLENNGIADRIMTLVEKNVDHVFLQKKVVSLQENSILLEKQNKEYQQEMGVRLNNLHSKVEQMKIHKTSLFKKMEVIYLENVSLQKMIRSLVNTNIFLSEELTKTSQIIRNLVNEAQHEISRTSEILSKKFWANLTQSWKQKTTNNMDIFSQNTNRDDQEELLDQMKQSSSEANEERMSMAKLSLEKVCLYLEGKEGEDVDDKELSGNLTRQLSANARGIVQGLWCLWQKEKNEAVIAKLKLDSVNKNNNVLGKRGTMAN
jgi:hypothetical protein